MSVASYLTGLGVLTALVFPLGLAARHLRIRLLADWSGPLARLAECIFFLALVFSVAQALGTVGQLRRWSLVAAAMVVGLAVCLAARGRRPTTARRSTPSKPHAAPRHDRRAWAPALMVVALLALVAIPWLGRTLIVLRTGMWDYDSLNYHLPFAARFVQEGSITSLHFTPLGAEAPFFPQNNELLHAIGMLAFGTDVLSPLLNLGWLSLALLAAWCAGSTRNVAPATLAASIVVLACPLFVEFDAGQANNDIADIALLLAAVALLVNSERRSGPVALAAAAGGMALANKLTMALPVAALTVGVILAAGRGRRMRAARDWFPWLLATGAFWYVRNLIVVANPVPYLHVAIGPISLPSPRTRPSFVMQSVAHYLTDGDIWRSAFLPGLHRSLGWVWPMIVCLAAIGWVIGVLHRDRLLRVLGVAGILAFIGYLVTRGGAAGFRHLPFLFVFNLRWAFPAIALGLIVLALATSALSRTRRWLLPTLFGATALVSEIYYASKMRPSLALARALGVVLSALALAGLIFVAWSRRANRALLAVGVVVALFAGTGLGWVVQRSYFTRRWTDVDRSRIYKGAPLVELSALYEWARDVSDARIAVAGVDVHYPLYGPDLSNHVQYVGDEGPHGAFDRAESCEQWRRLVNDGPYDYVVTSAQSWLAPEPIEATWTRTDPAVTTILQAGTATVFRVHGALDASTCR